MPAGSRRALPAAVAKYDQLGDDCDFLTLAGDWPYRYQVEAGEYPARGIYALDDLIGRTLVGGPSLGGIEKSRRRWAYAGRIIGDPAASVARAMGALFLHPRSALLWNTYGRGTTWSTYNMKSASAQLSRVLPGPIEHAEGPQSDLEHWHATFAPLNRFGLLLINTTGGPGMFSIAGGPGRPGDVPRGVLTAVSMIHSFSAANLADPDTIAGRWLANGAYVYFGSVHEPFLPAFRPPGLVTELIAADVPLVCRPAAKRARAVRVSVATDLPGRPALPRRPQTGGEQFPHCRREERRIEESQADRATVELVVECDRPGKLARERRRGPHRREPVGEGSGRSRAAAGGTDRRDGREGEPAGRKQRGG